MPAASGPLAAAQVAFEQAKPKQAALLNFPAEMTIEASRPFFDRIKGPKELVLLENCGHLPIEEPGLSRLEEAVVAFLRTLTGRQSSP